MYKRKFISLPSFFDYGKEQRRSYDVAAGDYGINHCGFLRSDFAELQERQDSSSLARLLSRFVELKEQDSDSSLTDEQRFSMLRPRAFQTPAELDRFEQYCIDQGIEFARSLMNDPVKKKVVELSSGATDSGDSSGESQS